MTQQVDGAAVEPAPMSTGMFPPTSGSGTHAYGVGDSVHSIAPPPFDTKPIPSHNSLPPDVVAGVHEMQRQLHYAAMVRANYEKQLQQLATALQTERVSKGERSLRVHELMQEVEGLQHAKRELHDQVEHWRYRAQEKLEQKAVDVMRSDSQSQGSSTATEDILLDIKKLQESEAYWRHQAKSLVHEYEEAENDVCKMIRELQHEREILRSKEASEKRMREEIDYLQKALRSIASSRNSQSSEHSMETGIQKVSARNDGTLQRSTPAQDGGHTYLNWQTTPNADASAHSDGPPNLSVNTALHSTHSSSTVHNNGNRPALVRTAAPQPSDHYGFENPTARGTFPGTSDAEKMYSSYASARSHMNSHLAGTASPANNPSSTKKQPNYDKVVQLQMDLLQLGRYEEAEKLSLQFSADDLSVDQIDGLLIEMHSGAQGPASDQIACSIGGPQNMTSSHGEADPPACRHFESAAEPIVHCARLTTTRAATPGAMKPEYCSGASHAPGFSAIGEANVQELDSSQKLSQHQRSLQIPDLQDQGSPSPQWAPSIGPSHAPSFARTRSTGPPMHEKLALENKLASLAAIQKTPIPTEQASNEAWIMRVNVIQASANISSRSFHSIHHVQAGQNTSPLAVVDGALEITAMDRTSLADTEERTRFNETLCLTEMHPSAVHLAGDTCPNAHELAAQELDGRPALLFASIHTIDGQKVCQVGRTAVLIQGKGVHSQSFTLLHSNGTPVLSKTGHPATIQLGYSYAPASESESAMLYTVQGPEPATPSRARPRPSSKRTSSSSSKRSLEGSPHVSATLGFFNSASGSANHSGASSQRNSARSMGAIDVSTDADTTAKPPVTVVPPSNFRSAHGNSDVSAMGASGAEVGSHTSTSLGTSQSSVREHGLATSQSSVSATSDRLSPKLVPTSVSRKYRKAQSKDFGAAMGDPAEGPDKLNELGVETVYIVRQSSNENSTKKSRVGIGISFGVTRSGETFITGLSTKGQAKASGKIKEGDQLLAVDDVNIKGWQVSDIVQVILGKPGTKVKLDIKPDLAQTSSAPSAAPSAGNAVPPTEFKEPEPSARPVRSAPPRNQPGFETPAPQTRKAPEVDAPTMHTPSQASKDGISTTEASPIGPGMNGTMTQAQWARRQLAKMGDGFSQQIHPKNPPANSR